MPRRLYAVEGVQVDKLVHGGQALGHTTDGKKVFLWNALPGETVAAELKRRKKTYDEGVATRIAEPSSHRITPKDEAFLSTSPWQIMDFAYEQSQKAAILQEAFVREGIAVELPKMVTDGQEFGYRNKMEYSFWGDDDGLHLALFHRGTHAKRIIRGSSIARPELDQVAQKMCSILHENDVRASTLKTVVVRCTQAGKTVVALYVKDADFMEISGLKNVADGVEVWFSNPKSPASVQTKKLYVCGDTQLTDTINGNNIAYGVTSFFQVNVPVFELALADISRVLQGQRFMDFYSGVGAIGAGTGHASSLVESDPNNITFAKQNALTDMRVIAAKAEDATDHIHGDMPIVVDPPRAGLHRSVTDALLETKPPMIVYLSCNPSTQARDAALLSSAYSLQRLTGYNFFPRTPHIESLAILERI